MFSKQELKELAGYRGERSPVLSVYLNVDTTQLTAEQYRLTLKGMLKSVSDKATRQDIEAVQRYVGLEYDRQAKGIAIFSCAGQDYWQAYPLAVAVGDHVHVSSQAYVNPLADFFDAYDRYGVVVVDREGARLYLFNQGTLQDATGTLGQELKESTRDAAGRGGRSGRGSSGGRSGLGRSSGLDSKIEQVTTRNLREVVELTQSFYRTGQCERIILGGTDENRARFASMLPKMLQSKVIGECAIDMYASATEVLDLSMGIIRQSVAERKAALVEGTIAASRKEAGSLGLALTLVAVQEQRVQTLVIHEGFRAPGYVCTHCSYPTLRETDKCPVCGGAARKLDDIVDYLVHRAIESDVEVVFVRDEAMEKVGSIGALWRF